MKSYKLLLILSSLASSLLITSCNSSSEKEAVPGIDSPKQRMDDSMPQAEEGLDNEDLEMLIRNFFLAYDTANNDDDFNQYLFDYYSRELWSKYREQEGETPYQYIRKTHYIDRISLVNEAKESYQYRVDFAFDYELNNRSGISKGYNLITFNEEGLIIDRQEFQSSHTSSSNRSSSSEYSKDIEVAEEESGLAYHKQTIRDCLASYDQAYTYQDMQSYLNNYYVGEAYSSCQALEGNSYNNYTYKNHVIPRYGIQLISTQANSWTYGVSFTFEYSTASNSRIKTVEGYNEFVLNYGGAIIYREQ
ncbi:MAG: hypothetical protein CMN34_01420 [Saprospirales bacterium]|nr:hypothetical protein [Saprospirales bacterium]